MITTILVPLLNGLLLGGGFLLLVRTVGKRYAVQLHAALLLIAALLYVAFAARTGSGSGVALELCGTVLFGGIALRGLVRRSSFLLALGWALHPTWDVAFHISGAGAGYTPDGYVVACIAFDLLLAFAIAYGWAALPGATGRAAPAATLTEATRSAHRAGRLARR